MDALEIVLLYDYYGDLLTQRQKECFEMRYYQDLSLGGRLERSWASAARASMTI